MITQCDGCLLWDTRKVGEYAQVGCYDSLRLALAVRSKGFSLTLDRPLLCCLNAALRRSRIREIESSAVGHLHVAAITAATGTEGVTT